MSTPITYSECVSVALVIQHVLYYIVIYSLSGSTAFSPDYYYYYYYYYLLQLNFHSVAAVLTLVTNKNEYT